MAGGGRSFDSWHRKTIMEKKSKEEGKGRVGDMQCREQWTARAYRVSTSVDSPIWPTRCTRLPPWWASSAVPGMIIVVSSHHTRYAEYIHPSPQYRTRVAASKGLLKSPVIR
jgi:hypothetical protein